MSESVESGREDAVSIEYVHAMVLSFVSVGVEGSFVSGSTVYTDMVFDVLVSGACLYTACHEGGESAYGECDGKCAAMMFEESLVSSYYAGEDSARMDGIMSSGVDDKVGAVETAVSSVCSVVMFESLYFRTKAVPAFDEETGYGVVSSDSDVPGVMRVHIADGEESGEPNRERPLVS